MADSSQTSAPSDRLPWPFAAAALVAFAAMYLTGKRFIAMPVLAFVLLASYFTRVRLPSSRILGWTIRITLWLVIITLSPGRDPTGTSIVFEQDYVNVFGYLCAAELVQRAWTRSAAGTNRGMSRGEALILT